VSVVKIDAPEEHVGDGDDILEANLILIVNKKCHEYAYVNYSPNQALNTKVIATVADVRA